MPRLHARAPSATRVLTVSVRAVLVVSLLGSVAVVGTAHLAPSRPRARHEDHIELVSATSERCPWANAPLASSSTAGQLAAEVLARMTLIEKADFVVLRAVGPYENESPGVPSLCIPPLTLQDGPNGVAYRIRGVTQLPASIGIAASFETGLAFDYGRVLGEEALGKGIDVVQGPNLNLARVPESGRIFEGYGEDPLLVSLMGDADIEGIQSTGTLADAKHFTAYNQETARSVLDQVVPERSLQELYLVPFEAAVRQAHVASLMCAYGSIDGVNTCSDRSLYSILYKQWHFSGFVRSDLGSVSSPAAAFAAGLSLIKPGSPTVLVRDVKDHRLALSALDTAVERVLEAMFAYGLVDHPRPLTPHALVATRTHAAFALRAAEASMVLLKNSGILPLTRRGESLAVIGSDAGPLAMSAGHGSARVVAPFLDPPEEALRAWSGSKVTWVAGGPGFSPLPPIPAQDFVSGGPLPSAVGRHHRRGEPGKSDIHVVHSPGVTRSVATAESPVVGRYPWSSWSATIVPPRTGLYDLSLTESGDTWLSINGADVLASPGLHGDYPWITAVPLVAGRRYELRLEWFQADDPLPRLGWEDVTPAIDAAATAARHAHVAVVFVSDFNAEGFDRPTLALPGDADALIEAVAKANPNTVVVLNTGGAVLMPWLKDAKAVLEAWYPGEEDGAATAAVLSGAVDPAGHLPITFPPTNAEVPADEPSAFPGVDATVSYREGLDIGYRWYEAHVVTPLFPFGYGLTYTTFALRDLAVHDGRRADTVRVVVDDTGRRRGSAVVQCYLEFPQSAGEPPAQLRSFGRVTLAPGQRATVTMTLDRAAFEAYLGGRFVVPSGTFHVAVGQSSAALVARAALVAPSD